MTVARMVDRPSVRWHVRWLFPALFLIVPTTARALSLHDVIQLSNAGYSDKRIISLISATQSRFQVDADSLVTLTEAGVSDRVLQAIIEARAPHDALASGPSAPPSQAARASPMPGSSTKVNSTNAAKAPK